MWRDRNNRVGQMGRFNFLRRQKRGKKDRRLVLGLSSDRVIALVMMQNQVISRAVFTEGDDAQHRADMARWLVSESLVGLTCDIVLLQGYYQLVQVDKPAVGDDELKDALVWAIKDLVPMSPEHLLLDYIDVPGSVSAGRINVAVADIHKLQPWTALLAHHKVSPKFITVEELALVESVRHQQFPVLILSQHGQHELLLMIAYQQQLFVSRRIRGFNAIETVAANSLMMDSLILETQRAMDYFESGMRQPPVKQIWLNFDIADPTLLVDGMASALPVDISAFADMSKIDELSATELVLASVVAREEGNDENAH